MPRSTLGPGRLVAWEQTKGPVFKKLKLAPYRVLSRWMRLGHFTLTHPTGEVLNDETSAVALLKLAF